MKKSITMLLLIIAIIFAGIEAVSADSPSNYTLDVGGGQNTVLATIDTTFASVLAGNTATIDPSFNATNSGNGVANVSVVYTINNSVYGFVGASSSIAGTYTDIQHDALGWDTLTASVTPTLITGQIAAAVGGTPNVDNFGIRVRVPAGQANEVYSAQIQVTFSDPA